MINTHGKILISAFIALIVGIVFIQTIADSIESVKTGSATANVETLSFSDLTTAVLNETQVNPNGTEGSNWTLTFNDLTAFTEVRNSSATIVTGDCNITLANGIASCNVTNSTNLFFDYTYISGKTETLANDEILTFLMLRNTTATGVDIIGFCNVTFSSGNVVCNNTYGSVGFANYTYIPDGFVRDATSRTILTLVILFFAIGILAVGLGMTIKSFKEGDLF